MNNVSILETPEVLGFACGVGFAGDLVKYGVVAVAALQVVNMVSKQYPQKCSKVGAVTILSANTTIALNLDTAAKRLRQN